jgi:hypothetical protein
MIRLLMVVALTASLKAWGHDPGLSSATVDLSSHDVLVQLVFAPSDLARLPANLAVQSVEMRAGSTILFPKVAETRELGPDNLEFTLRYPRPPGVEVTFRSALLGRLPFGHRQSLIVRNEAGATTATEMLSADHPGIPLPAAKKLLPSPPTRFTPLLGVGALAIGLAGWWITRQRPIKAAL